jgi:hypothetical protein
VVTVVGVLQTNKKMICNKEMRQQKAVAADIIFLFFRHFQRTAWQTVRANQLRFYPFKEIVSRIQT